MVIVSWSSLLLYSPYIRDPSGVGALFISLILTFPSALDGDWYATLMWCLVYNRKWRLTAKENLKNINESLRLLTADGVRHPMRI